MIDLEILLAAYASGWFPMAVAPGEIRWYSPDPRGIIPFDRFHVPSRLARVVASGRFEIRIDADFAGVMRGCAERRGPEGTWIDEEIVESYVALHDAGFAHSVEAWQQGRLVGGLYGVALGGAFFGESMFHRVADASKVALVALVERLRAKGFLLLDTQWVTEHLQQFGALEIPRRRYLKLLAQAIEREASFDTP
ncbi:MAG TPA: leucyl/phenylalanyl-tRNA--protein transferase [Vicinamibacterales bacterium]|jgi:leucyl/phenylalanyl-tRNA---protein transferase|nr:leucyl/phenylalanyl-tRNA--protein transferase [Vicinamibacterales bacterium]